MARTPQRSRGPAHDPFRLERLIGIGVGVGVVIFVMALIWRDRPFASPDLARMARIILSLGMAAIGATIPGFLRVDYRLGGAVMRATGGFGMFLVSFFGSPHVESLKLGTANLELSPIGMIEFRAVAAPETLADLDLAAPTGITIYLKGVNKVDQLGRPAVIESSVVDLVRGDGVGVRYDWMYFVSHVTGKIGVGGPEQVYLGAQEDAAPIAVPPGNTLSRSILHMAPQPAAAVAQPWQGTLDAALTGGLVRVSVRLALAPAGSADASCVIDAAVVKRNLDTWISAKAVLPRFFQAPCKGDSTWHFSA